MLLGCLTQRAGKEIQWDAANMKAENWPQGDVFIKRKCRTGWEVQLFREIGMSNFPFRLSSQPRATDGKLVGNTVSVMSSTD